MPWTYDPATRRYRDEDSGRELTEAQLRPVFRAFVSASLTRTREITGELANNRITIPEWEVEMRRIVKETYGAAYVLSRGGRNVMTQSDWGRLGQLSRRQYQYLNSYAIDIEAAGLTRDRALSRSDLYVLSSRQAYQRGKLAAWSDLPRLERVPGDGSTACIANCRCELEIESTDDGWNVYWLDLGDDRECKDCRQLSAEWAPREITRKRAPEPARVEREIVADESLRRDVEELRGEVELLSERPTVPSYVVRKIVQRDSAGRIVAVVEQHKPDE